MQMISKFMKCESGATAIEYGLIAALIGVSIVTIVQSVGVELQGLFGEVISGLQKRTH